MIDYILFGIIILCVAVCCGYLAFRILTYIARQHAEKEFLTENQKLHQWQANLQSQSALFEQRKNSELNSIIQKKDEAIIVYKAAFDNLIISEKTRETVQTKVNSLEKQIDQLKSELFQARKRAERLANKAKNAVQISD